FPFACYRSGHHNGAGYCLLGYPSQALIKPAQDIAPAEPTEKSGTAVEAEAPEMDPLQEPQNAQGMICVF
ncbi:hypothetical protein X975_06043, partial [Stegodyphus mimosarum]